MSVLQAEVFKQQQPETLRTLKLTKDGLKDSTFVLGSETQSIKDVCPSHCKKVKFGSDSDAAAIVETFVFETTAGNYHPPENFLRPEPAASPTRLRVEIIDTQVPSQITPPVRESELVRSTASSLDSRPSSAADHASPSTKCSNLTPTSLLRSYSPLPRSMEEEQADNPFRPDGRLSHEVEPIVEEYKRKPFPHSSPSTSPTRLTPFDVVDAKQSAQQRNGESVAQQQVKVQRRSLATEKATAPQVVRLSDQPRKSKCGGKCCSVQ